MMDEPIKIEAIKPEITGGLCIDCNILSNEDDRKKCTELTSKFVKEEINLEELNTNLLKELSGNEEEKADKFISIICDADKITTEQENGKKEELVWKK